MRLHLLEPGSVVTMGTHNLVLDTLKPTYYVSTYTSCVSRLMQPPYKTMCREYPLNQLTDDCFVLCTRETTIRRYKRIPASYNIFVDDQNLTIFDQRVFEGEKKTEKFPDGYTSIMESIQAQCYNLCKSPECKSVVHISNIESTVNVSFKKRSMLL